MIDTIRRRLLKRPTVVGIRRFVRARLIELQAAGRRFKRRFWPGAPSATVLFAGALLAVGIVFFITDVVGWHLWGDGDHFCHKHEFGCDLGIHVGGTALVGLIAFYVFFLRREARAARKWRSIARKAPQSLFTSLPPLHGLTGEAMSSEGLVRRQREHGSRLDRWRRRRFAKNQLIASVISRDQLVAALADDLDEGPGPRILVATSGSGKTMVLLKLAHDLAQRGQVSVAVALSGKKDVDFEELAREAYRRRSWAHQEEADKRWEWLRKRRRITILADELEKCKDKLPQRVQALEAASRDGLRVVVTSRPDGIPPTYRQGRIDLEPLDEEEVIDDLAKRVNAAPDGSGRLDRDELRQIVEQADICSTPYYLALARVLADLGMLRMPGKRENARLLLLQGYRDVIANGWIRPDVGLTPKTRTEDLKALEVIALARILGAKTEQKISQKIDKLCPNNEINVHDVVARTQRLGVLVNRYDGQVRFGHPTTLAYFASCCLSKHKPHERVWNEVFTQKRVEGDPPRKRSVPRQITPLMALMLTLANSAAGDHEVTEDTVERLLKAASSSNGHRDEGSDSHDRDLAFAPQNGSGPEPNGTGRLALVATAAEVAVWDPVADRQLRSAIVTSARVEDCCAEEVASVQLRLVQAIARLDTPDAFEELWSYAMGQGSYRFRRQAAKALIAAGVSALPLVTSRVCDAVDEGMRELARNGKALAKNPPGLYDRLGAAAWVLPSFRTIAATDADEHPELKRLDAAQDDIILLAKKLTHQRGLEASVAQGLKLDAVQRPGPEIDGRAIAMLDKEISTRARFWFSRVLVLQAITRRSIEASTEMRKTARALVIEAQEDKHPFVRENAALCLLAIDHSDWYRYQWDDIMEIAESTPHGLAIEATQLIGDMLLALNLNENGKNKAHLKFGNSNCLPACLSASKDRLEILGSVGPIADCSFATAGHPCFCPYRYETPSNGTVRRELSRAFCRHQRLTARRVPWQKHMSVRALKDFWSDMEDLAQF